MNVELGVEARPRTGKGAARSLRRQDKIPGVIYGPKADPLPVSVADNALEKLLREMGEESKLLKVTVDDGQTRQMRQVLIREVQVHPVRRRFLHVDFYEVPLDHPIVVEVPVEVLGEAVGVRDGGVLNVISRTLAVRCLPGDIPEKVQIDVSSLEIGSTVHVADLIQQVPFELVDDAHLTVVTVNAPEAIAEPVAAEESEEEAAGAIVETAEGEEVTTE